DLQPQLDPGQVNDRPAGDPFQQVAGHRRGDQPALSGDEEVGRGRFGDVAVLVEDDGLVKATEHGVAFGQGAVDVGAVDLAPGRNGRVIHPPPTADADVDRLVRFDVAAAQGLAKDGHFVGGVVQPHPEDAVVFVGDGPDVDIVAPAFPAKQLQGDLH